MWPNLPFVSAKHTLVTYNITLLLITKTNQGPRWFQRVCLFMHAPPPLSSSASILQYIKGTFHHGLDISCTTSVDLIAYINADWVGCLDNRRSISSFCIFLGGNLVSWSSRKIIFTDHNPKPPFVFCVNVSTIYLSTSLVQHQWIKHIKIYLDFVWHKVALWQIKGLHVLSLSQICGHFH
jgi:hypothetical protein